MNWVGIKTAFSTLRHGTPLEVWVSPSVARWDYEATEENGPYRLIRASNGEVATGAVYGYAESPSFVGLMNEFATIHMPRRGEVCAILDRHCHIVLGWLWRDDIEAFDWQGCEYGFKLLELHHPINAAIWCTQAHERQCAYLNDLKEFG